MATPTSETAVERALRSLAPPTVRVGVRSIDPSDLESLHPEERVAVIRAVPRRQAEFASGRALLRSLLDRSVAIPVAPSRAPLLPDGVRASLAHDDRYAVAAVSTDATIAALGIDIEPDTTLSTTLTQSILRSDEPPIDAHLAFTLKEAAYKAWSSLGGRIIDHHDVTLLSDDGTFTATVLDDGTMFHGRFARAAGRWLALVVVTR